MDVWLFFEIVGKVNILEQKTRVKGFRDEYDERILSPCQSVEEK